MFVSLNTYMCANNSNPGDTGMIPKMIPKVSSIKN